MKRWFLYTVSFSLLMLLSASVTVHAQEAGMSDEEIVLESGSAETEKMIFSPGENVRYVPNATSASPENDSSSLQIYDFPMQQAIMKSPEEPDDKKARKTKDDSILTFNFLYYIIQKYKLQDIID